MGKYSGGSGHSDDLAALNKKRATYVDETNKGGRFNEGLLKMVTGGAKNMKVSHKGEKEFNMTPMYTFWFASNHKPRLTETGKPMARRVKLVKFLSSVDSGKEDTSLADRILQNEGDILLSWMVKGAVEWYKQGLNTPEIVQEWTKEYLHDEDKYQLWLEQCTEKGKGYTARYSECYASFIGFCKLNGYFGIDQGDFNKRMEEKGFEHTRRNSGMVWKGFKITQLNLEADEVDIPPMESIQ
jgi:putative DNA primase/helicase